MRSPSPDSSLSTRHALIERARDQLARTSSPRLYASLIVTLSGVTAFLASVVMLRAGVTGMTVRYAMAACAGYLAFVALIRVWITFQRRSVVDDVASSLGDIVNAGGGNGSSGRAVEGWRFGGGRSGGGGASRAFVAPGASSRPVTGGAPVARGSSGGGWSLDLDLDELWWVVLAIALACAGIIAVGYVIYAAPLLLGEVALDAALLGGAYRRLKRSDMQHWATGVLRRTAIPAAIVVACAAGFGYCGERLAPQARSIGGVISALTHN